MEYLTVWVPIGAHRAVGLSGHLSNDVIGMLAAVAGLLIPVVAVHLRHRQPPERPISREPELPIL